MRSRPEKSRSRGAIGAGAAFAAAVALAFAAALLVAGSTPLGRELERTFVRRSAPERALGSPRLRAALLRDRLVELHRPADGAAAPPGDCAPIELGPRTEPAATPAEEPLGEDAPPLVELELDRCRADRLHAQPEGRGRATEETGWVSIRFPGGGRFATAVGVRLHGGTSRSAPPYSYRLYFREGYGAAGAPGEIVDDPARGPVARLVLNELDDRDRDGTPFPFPGEVSFAVARRLGAETPGFRPVLFSLNGEPPRPAMALEQIGNEFLRRRFGHANFDLVRGKRLPGDADQELFARELDWVESRPAPLTAEAAGARYDLDSLLAWLATVAFCGTGDLYQDALVRDRSGEVRGGRWFWIHWDHDMSFRTPPGNSRFGRYRDALEAVFWSRRPSDSAPARSLLKRLLAEDPSFRARVEQRFDAALGAELTPEFLAAVVARYETEARRLAIADLHFAPALRDYFARRPEALREQVATAMALATVAGAEPDRIRYGNRRRAPAAAREKEPTGSNR